MPKSHRQCPSICGIAAFAVLCVITASAASANGFWKAAGYQHDTWGQAAGLTSAPINAIAQTRKGYIWFGSVDGLRRFDGVRFRHFSRRNTPVLKDQEIAALAADDEGPWIGTRVGGLIRYRRGVFRRYGRSDGLPDDHIHCLAFSDGKLWVGTENGVAVCNGERFTRVLESVVSGAVTALTSGSAGALWIGAGRAVLRAVGQQVAAFRLPDESSVESISVDRADDVLVASSERICELRGQILVRAGLPTHTPSPSQILLRDSRDGLWLQPPQGGLVRVDLAGEKRQLSTARAGSVEHISPDEEISTLFEDREGNIWGGTLKGNVHRFRERPFVTIDHRDGLSSDYIYSLYEDDKGVL